MMTPSTPFGPQILTFFFRHLYIVLLIEETVMLWWNY